MNLVIDIGNTFTKLAVFEGDTLVDVIQQDTFLEEDILSVKNKYSITSGIFSSVKGEKKQHQLLKKHNFYALTHTTPIPLDLLYKTPDTLGLDRIAAVVGARTLIKEGDVLVIDMGTCITYDIINTDDEYMGGSISPGFNMRFKSLHHFTGKLPMIHYKKEHVKLIGDSTEKAIKSGVFNGLYHEITGIINSYLKQYEDLKIVITGGDAILFDLAPKNRIFADKFLVLKGLNEILRYNEEK